MNAPVTLSGGLRGIPAPASTLDLRAQADGQLHALLLAEGITPRAVYRPGEVCRLLRIRGLLTKRTKLYAKDLQPFLNKGFQSLPIPVSSWSVP